MDISSVSSMNGGIGTQNNAGKIQQLQKQISDLEKKISKTTSDDSLDSDTKTTLIASYQVQVQALESQIQQLQNKSTSTAQSKNASETQEKNATKYAQEDDKDSSISETGNVDLMA